VKFVADSFLRAIGNRGVNCRYEIHDTRLSYVEYLQASVVCGRLKLEAWSDERLDCTD
jgi:hypothetical protein